MSFDISRLTFNPWNNFFGPVTQQGRVQLDSEANEWIAQVARRVQAGTYDTFGQAPGPGAVYPATTPGAFSLTINGNSLVIGPGRMYVDGLLAENHGQPAPVTQPWVPPGAPSNPGVTWDNVLDESVGPAGVPYEQQPYLPGAGQFPADGANYLVYLDVWKREVTFVENPDLVEKAVGFDTTGRLQTVWQVKYLPIDNAISNPTCSSDIPAWDQLLLPPGASLTTGVMQMGAPGPCCLTPNTGYTGLENQFYRLEIHQPAAVPINTAPSAPTAPSPATFKWSRDNASVATSVNTITQGGLVLGVDSVGKDNVLCFKPNDWVEITDDWLELAGQPGELHQVAPNGVDPSAKTLTLTKALVTPANFPVANGSTDPSRHTRVRRWDQSGQILQVDAQGNQSNYFNLDTQGQGDIPVPAPGTTLLLEDGITVTFGWDTSKPVAQLKCGDFWNFAARATDGTVEYLDHAPPRGIHHHYCRLGVGNLTAKFSDCRTAWPPASGGDGCECAACVTADGHNAGTFTIQDAIKKVTGLGGGKVCLGPGVYQLKQTITIISATSLTIAGHGGTWLNWAPAAPPVTPTPAILIDSSVAVTLENLGFWVPAASTNPLLSNAGTSQRTLNAGVMIQNSGFVTVTECAFLCATNADPDNPAIALGGVVVQTILKNNFISFSQPDKTGSIGAGAGLSHLPTIALGDAKPNPFLLTLDLYVQDNFIQTSSSGIHLDNLSYHAWQVRIQNNFVGPSSVAGITVAGIGLPAPEASVEISDNQIVASTTGHGIVCGVDAARVTDNDILCLDANTGLANNPTFGDGILLDAPLLAAISLPLNGLQLVGNRIAGVGGIGIEIRAQVASVTIERNLMQNTGAGGIIMTGSAAGVPSTAQCLSIVNNQLLELVPDISNPMVTGALNAALGIRLLLTADAEIAGNIVRNLAINLSANNSTSQVGIGLFACASVRISHNQVVTVGDDQINSNPSAGIAIVGPPVGRVEVSGNTSKRNEALTPAKSSTRWYALFIGPLANFIVPPRFRFVQLDVNITALLTDSFVSNINLGLQSVAVRGNFLQASTVSALTEVILNGTSGTESCIFTENQCVLVTIAGADGSGSGINAALAAPAVVAGNNFIQGGDVALNISTYTSSKKPAKATILGNILNGGAIELNGSPLPANSPWVSLNV